MLIPPRSFLITLFQSSGYVHLKPRAFSPLGWFARYDGNVIGGLLLGHGMALSGACPGTVLSQAALGVRSGYHALAGATLGGIVWAGFLRPYLSRSTKPSARPDDKLSIQELLGVTRTSAFVGFEAVLLAAITSTALWGASSSAETKISPIVGGLAIGGAQLLSLAWRKSVIGVSGSYEEVGEWFWSIVRGGPPPKYTSILFSLGLVGGSWVIVHLLPSLGELAEVQVTPLSAELGGFLMVVGSRMAGGCTSGHGISGMSLLSTSGFITMGVAMVWGAVAATFW
jgi:uncharacterized membrane protein YedE/YeeE